MSSLTGVESLEKAAYSGPRLDVAGLVPVTARKILDVGCARGELGSVLKERLGDVHVTGIEMSSTLAQQAETRLDRVLAGTIEDALGDLPDDSFDCVIFADVLEHLVNPYAVLASVKLKLRQSGVLVASIPNVRHHRVLRSLILHGRWEYAEGGLLDSGHLRFFTLSGIRTMFEWAGYDVAVPAVNRVGLRRMWKGHRQIGNPLMQFLDYQYLIAARLSSGHADSTPPWWSTAKSI